MRVGVSANLSAAFVRSVLDYDPVTGRLTWRLRSDRLRAWNSRFVGRETGTSYQYGAKQVRINDRLYLAHRVAWLHHYGEWPVSGIDHINGDPGDNRIVNLRLADHSQNGQNRGAQKNNSSGFKGVTYDKKNKKWRAKISVSGKHYDLGRHETAELAALAYERAVVELHSGFGRLKPESDRPCKPTTSLIRAPVNYDTADLVRSVLDYNPDTGIFLWRRRPDRTEAWNAEFAGREAGYLNAGYRVIRINKLCTYQATRLAWLLTHGTWPPADKHVDHINGNPHDNRAINLRLASIAENARNRGAQSNNALGLKGVRFEAARGLYRVQIVVDGKQRIVGRFRTKKEASDAYERACLRYHGEFAKT
ncbi:MAG TPA: HNH endonuclease [Bradyrhizobium sp.]|nr:HNH endonuclease [Bradyrhizobium sp.]